MTIDEIFNDNNIQKPVLINKGAQYFLLHCTQSGTFALGLDMIANTTGEGYVSTSKGWSLILLTSSGWSVVTS